MIGKLNRYGSLALAHAILERGEKENDQVFLQSDWCEWLRTFCREGDKLVSPHHKPTQVAYHERC